MTAKMVKKIEVIKSNTQSQPEFLLNKGNREMAEALMAESREYDREMEGLVSLIYQWGYCEGTNYQTPEQSSAKHSDITRNILFALGYTPSTLAADLGVGVSVAKRLLCYGKKLKFSDITILSRMLGISVNTLVGFEEPGSRGQKEKAALQSRQI